MRTVDIVAGIVLVALAGVVLTESLGLQFYSEGVPGPGFFPSLLAIALAFSGALLILMRVRKPAEALPEFERPSRSQARRSIGAWVAMVIAALAINVVGFLVAMVFLVAVLLLWIERRTSLGTFASVVLTPLLAYLLFAVLLQVQLPTGLFGD